MRDIGSAFRCEHGQEYDITPELLWLIYGEDNPEFNEKYIMPDFKFLKSFMDSELDCDTVTDTAIKLAHKMPIMEQYGFSSGKGIPVLLPHTSKSTNIMARSSLLQD